ncbi:hypothetical protein [Parapedobacter tibetensis]|uniref:hypothetical protein n=1 Tax=Parapedobacter tibetensis TaxID=2972951 RepID=UPI00214D5DC2|nr:hypothetical protein [Parapedobacter tibetensis]
MDRLNLAILWLSIILISSCNNASTSGEDETEDLNLLSITNNPENPSRIFLRLTDKMEGDTSISYAAKGLYQDDTVGFFIEIDKNIPAGINQDGSADNEVGFKKGWIKFRKSGIESDRFVSALAELWQVDSIVNMKTQTIQPLVFSSNKTAIDHSKPSTSSFKLFFDDDSLNPGEIFFTFDTYKKGIEFQEKDAKYRSAIVRSFSE